MIIDKIGNALFYSGLGAELQQALQYLAPGTWLDKPEGKYPIYGDDIYAVVKEYEPRKAEDCHFESHREYIDIQCVLAGEEVMLYAPVSALVPYRAYMAEKDCALWDGEGTPICLKTGMFSILMPWDGHMPEIRSAAGNTKVKKLVIKVKSRKL